MITRKKRNLIISLVVLLILIIAIVLVLLYLNTDMFKSNEYLFTKYIGKNVENIQTFMQIFEKDEYDKSLEENQYKVNTQIKVNYTENVGTTSENTENVINKLNLNIDGETDKLNQYNYQNIQLYNSNEKILDLEYVKDNDSYGYRLADMFKQYVFIKDSNIKELLSSAGLSQEQIEKIPNEIKFSDIKNPLTFNETEKQELKNKYLESVQQNISNNRYSKQANIDIIINENKITANAYILKLTKEELNNCYINILEKLIEDETILGKIDNIQKILLQYNIINENTLLRENFISNITNLINKIKSVNIGQDETIITVYENNGTTVSTSIETPEYKIDFDYLNEQFIQISYSNNEERNKSIKIENKENEINIEIINKDKENSIKNYTVNSKKTIQSNKMSRLITAKYEDYNNKIEANIEQNIEIVQKLASKETTQGENIIKLNELDEEGLKQITNTVITLTQEKFEKVKTQINLTDLQKILNIVGIINQVPNLENSGVTEVEKNRFNSKFELLQGEKLKKENVLKMIEAIRSNLISVDIVSNYELKFNLDRYNNNEEIANTMYDYIDKNSDKDYNIILEYDEETGLVKDIILRIVTKSE